MTHHINRWLLAFAAAYLVLLPTNTATFVRSVAFGGAVALRASSRCARASRDPSADPARRASIVVPLFAAGRVVVPSLRWSVDPAYSLTQLEREIGDSLLTMLVFYVAARDARSFRMLSAPRSPVSHAARCSRSEWTS